MLHTANLKTSLHQLVLETYDDALLSKVKSYFETAKAEQQIDEAQVEAPSGISLKEEEVMLEFAEL